MLVPIRRDNPEGLTRANSTIALSCHDGKEPYAASLLMPDDASPFSLYIPPLPRCRSQSVADPAAARGASCELRPAYTRPAGW
jgi:hypothetical protein